MKQTTDISLLSQKQMDFLKAHTVYCRRVTFVKVALFFLFLLQWELTTRFHLVNSFIFSSPSRILFCFLEYLQH